MRLRILWLLSSCSYHRMLQKAMATDESYTSRALPFVSRARARCGIILFSRFLRERHVRRTAECEREHAERDVAEAFAGGELRRRQHPGAGGDGGGAQAPRHVHRRHGRARLPPSRVRGGGQLDRRGAGGLLHAHRRADQPGRLAERDGQRARHSRGHAPDAAPPRHRGRADRPPRGRQVRRLELQGLGRPPRRGRLVRERALRLDEGGGEAQRQDPPH